MVSTEFVQTKIEEILVNVIHMPMDDIFKGLHGAVSTRTLNRILNDMPNVVNLSSYKNSTYAKVQSIDDKCIQEILETNKAGNVSKIGELYLLNEDCFFVKSEEGYDWLTIGSDTKIKGLFKSLPWFLSAMKPRGYLGRMWSKEYATKYPEFENVHAWTNADIVKANIEMNLDVSGNIEINNRSVQPFFQEVVKEETKLISYDQIIETLEREKMVGSSVDGEQQKFSVLIEDEHGNKKSVLVKTNHAIHDDIKEREGDLLIVEHVSNEVLRKHGYDASVTKILKSNDFIYLEAERFDRTDVGGKIGFCSLRSLCEATYFKGRQSEWIEALQHLQNMKLISKEELQKGTDLTVIGRLIENTDMHLGNLSLWLPNEEHKDFTITPSYDMTSMRWTPSLKGYVPVLHDFEKVAEAPERLLQIALEVWQGSASHPLISNDWKTFAEKKVDRLSKKLLEVKANTINKSVKTKKAKP